MRNRTGSRFFSIVAVFCLVMLSSCSKEADFDYDKSILMGKWKLVYAEVNSSYVDVTAYPYSDIFKPTYATFKSNGDYYGSGEFGTGSGTYSMSGKTVTCYVDGKEYVRYEVISLTSTECELKMFMGTDSMRIKCQKQ